MGGWVWSTVQFLWRCAPRFFGLGLVFAQFGLRSISPSHGVMLTVPSVTVLLWALVPIFLDWRAATLVSVGSFVAAGPLTPGTVILLTHMANRRMGPTIAGALGNLAPFFAVPAAAILLGEIPRSLQGLGILIVVVGVVLLPLTRPDSGKPWPLWAAALPIGAAAIRGLAQSIIIVGLIQ
ncbi:MAG TPA: EamA family transporter [Pseudolabrys sp.]|nr:EamA family transporter [Pseudolabrys sp.]